MNAPEFVPGGGAGPIGGPMMMGYPLAGPMGQEWPHLQQQPQHGGPQPPPQASPVQFNQAPQFHFTPYVPQQPIAEVQTFAINQRMSNMSINNRLHQFNPAAPGVGQPPQPQLPPPQQQQQQQPPQAGFNQVGGSVGIAMPRGLGPRNKHGRPPFGQNANPNYAQQVSNGSAVPQQQMGHPRQRGPRGGGGGFNHHNHHPNAQNHKNNSAQSSSPEGAADEHTPTEPEDAALCFLAEVICKLEDNPGLFDNYQKKLREIFYDLANNNFVMSNSLEMLFKQSTKSQNFRYMGARICNLLDELEPSEESLFRGLLRLKLDFEMHELMNFMQIETHTVRGTTLFMAELYMQLRKPTVSSRRVHLDVRTQPKRFPLIISYRLLLETMRSPIPLFSRLNYLRQELPQKILSVFVKP